MRERTLKYVWVALKFCTVKAKQFENRLQEEMLAASHLNMLREMNNMV
jgi:hypothetical protein